MSWQEESCNSFFPPRLKEHHRFNRRRQTTTCVVHVEMRSECSDQVANQQPAADQQHSENKEAAARRLMSKNRKSSAARQRLHPVAAATHKHTKSNTFTTRHALPSPPGPRDHRPGPHISSSAAAVPHFQCFIASFLAVFPPQQQRAPRSEQRNSVAAQLPLLAAPSSVFLSRVSSDIWAVMCCCPVLTTWMRCERSAARWRNCSLGHSRDDGVSLVLSLLFFLQSLLMFAFPVKPVLVVSAPWVPLPAGSHCRVLWVLTDLILAPQHGLLLCLLCA